MGLQVPERLRRIDRQLQWWNFEGLFCWTLAKNSNVERTDRTHHCVSDLCSTPDPPEQNRILERLRGFVVEPKPY